MTAQSFVSFLFPKLTVIEEMFSFFGGLIAVRAVLPKWWVTYPNQGAVLSLSWWRVISSRLVSELSNSHL